MKNFIFRNSTVEPLFKSEEAQFSGYDDISQINLDCDIFTWFYIIKNQIDSKALKDHTDFYFQNIEMVYNQIPETKFFFLFTLFDPYRSRIQTGDFSVLNTINEFNYKIIEFSKSKSNVKVIDIADFISENNDINIVDWKYFFISKMVLNPRLSKKFISWFRIQINSIMLKRKKCLVLDLDNTLWGGILGEDGINGIKLGEDYPGNAFSDFQKSILKIKDSGIILSICSKNNEDDVKEAWNKNPNILIKESDISSYRINWRNKADNIREIADELNIGLDSMVFVDDNPTERELVKQVLADVVVPDFPTQPYDLPNFTKKLINNYFQIYSLTQEDLNKTKQYKSNAQRANHRKSYIDFNKYLKSLELVLDIKSASSFSIPRISQMTQKTNQFNLTTIRYSEVDIKDLIKNKSWVYTLSVSDKFGDNVITGLIIIDLKDREAMINSFLLSCRILGKNIENQFIYFILNKLKKIGIERVSAKYISTAKNNQVKDFYENIGFELKNDFKSIKEYSLDLMNFDYKENTTYKIL